MIYSQELGSVSQHWLMLVETKVRDFTILDWFEGIENLHFVSVTILCRNLVFRVI